tara:strand:+ start:3445 stop:3687 length:243 start_codon:yes stop_codon:yes gene_type:complete
MGINFDLPEDFDTLETVWITCTDKNKTMEADIVSKKNNEIIMVLKTGGIRLGFRKANSFGKIKEGVWIANMSGLEFVYTE